MNSKKQAGSAPKRDILRARMPHLDRFRGDSPLTQKMRRVAAITGELPPDWANYIDWELRPDMGLDFFTA